MARNYSLNNIIDKKSIRTLMNIYNLRGLTIKQSIDQICRTPKKQIGQQTKLRNDWQIG
ncbi:hypothetical protein P278_07170 [Zhouia amylolytica AD3]|uniref:Uncharacterized protein n=1 Tax=Zhouia amylolytica AD3 TaxID=1286632 RepID=W2UQT0_9FLAO|nr:hypothetical protein P278_07170 [Zhouia amylolytica AD3]